MKTNRPPKTAAAKAVAGEPRRALMLELTELSPGRWRDDKHNVALVFGTYPLAGECWHIEHPAGTVVQAEIKSFDAAIVIAAAHVLHHWATDAYLKMKADALAKLLAFQLDVEAGRRDAHTLEGLIKKFMARCPRINQVCKPLPPLEQFQQLVNDTDCVFDFTIPEKRRSSK